MKWWNNAILKSAAKNNSATLNSEAITIPTATSTRWKSGIFNIK